MARTTRTRIRVLPFIQGSLSGVNNGVPYSVSNSGDAYRTTCDDSHGRPTIDSPLLITEIDRSNIVPTWGEYHSSNGIYNSAATSYIPTGGRLNALGPSLVPGRPSASASMTDLITRTNPSRPDYVPLTLIQDLVDIPKQLKDIGRLIRTPKRNLIHPKEVANQHLGFAFGWKPLFQDVRDMLDLQSHIHRRVGELHRLYNAGGLKRRIHLGKWTAVEDDNEWWETNPSFECQVARKGFITSDRWGTVRWKPDTGFPPYNPTDAEIIKTAKRVSLGLTVEGTMKGVWDVLPWTWMINWFTNIGAYAMQHSNTVPALPSSACVMTTTISKRSYSTKYITPGYSSVGGYATYTTKERYVGSGSITAHLPFITRDRLSILESLFIQRFMR